jgi:PAS domain S-box-containing protein
MTPDLDWELLLVENSALKREIEELRRYKIEQDGLLAEARNTERALVHTQQLLQLIIDHLPGAVFWKDTDLIYHGGNRQFAADAGVGEPANLIGLSDDNLAWSHDQTEQLREAGRRVLDTGEPVYGVVEPHPRADGTTGWRATNHIPLYSDEGMIIGILGTYEDITARKQQEEKLQRYVEIIEQTPDAISTADANANIVMMNAAFRHMVGCVPDDDIATFLIADVHPAWVVHKIEQEGIPTAIREGVWSGETALRNRITGEEHTVSQVILSHTRADGSVRFLSTIMRDLTSFKQAEAERAALQQQIIDAQRAALRELSAPLLPISAGAVIMPLIGTIDSQRAQQIMETLLNGVATHRADTAIIDITGVQVVDTQVANALVQAAQAVRLLGAQAVLTGIGPAMAQTLVSLGADLGSIITRGNLQAGIAYALRTSRGNGLKSGE